MNNLEIFMVVWTIIVIIVLYKAHRRISVLEDKVDEMEFETGDAFKRAESDFDVITEDVKVNTIAVRELLKKNNLYVHFPSKSPSIEEIPKWNKNSGLGVLGLVGATTTTNLNCKSKKPTPKRRRKK